MRPIEGRGPPDGSEEVEAAEDVERAAEAKANPTPSDPLDELFVDDKFDELETEMWDFLEKTRAEGLDVLKKMVALMEKYPGVIDDRTDMQRAATAIKQALEAIPTQYIGVSDLLKLVESDQGGPCRPARPHNARRVRRPRPHGAIYRRRNRAK